MRLCLRTIFETSSSGISPTTLRRAATLTLASLFAICAHSSSYEFNKFDRILGILPEQAIAYNPAEPNKIVNPHYEFDFQAALNDFRTNCPALPATVTTKNEAQEWVYNHIANANFLTTPLTFRNSAYNLAVTFDTSAQKNNVLTSLNKTIPNSPMLIHYLERKRVEIAHILQNDPDIRYAARHWNRINNDEYKQRIMQKISRITLDTLLPNKEIDYPRISWDRREANQGGLNGNTFAIYGNSDELITLNAKLEPINYNFQFAADIVIHETIHSFQSILISWGLKGKLQNFPEIDRYVNLLYSNKVDGAGAIRYNPKGEFYSGYRLTKIESMSWGYSLIGDTILNPALTKTLGEGTLERSMYTAFDARQPRRREFHTDLLHGAPIPTMPENPRAGSLPAACTRS